MARTAGAAKLFLLGGGIFYLVLWIYGTAVDQDSAANVVPVNTADNWLLIALGVGMIGAGLLALPPGSGRPPRPTRPVPFAPASNARRRRASTLRPETKRTRIIERNR
jgi:hypothetical protein